VRDCCTCSGEQTCHNGAIALDASHMVYLGRAACELVPGDAAGASELLVDMLRATACWRAGRLWTTEMIWHDQVDDQLALLGLTAPPGYGWSEYIATYGPAPAMTPVSASASGPHDEDLLRRVVDESSRHPTLLVTNDEDLFAQARQRTFEFGTVGFSSENSTSMMVRLLHCGAIPRDVVDACLVAEHKNIEQMRQAGMRQRKYDIKTRRLDRACQQLVLRDFDHDWSPEETGE